jgi:hypothetical protein
LPVDAREALDRDAQPGFLGDFSDDRVPRGLAILDSSARQLPEV